MKKIIYSVLMMAMAAFTFTSCEDVPMPYDNPNNPSGRDGGEIGESSLPFSSSSCNDFTAITVKGAPWSLGSSYAKATGYADGTTTETEAWLVSPAITLKTDVGAVITLDHVIRYTQSNNDLQKHQLLISDNFTGDVTSATWTQLAYEPKASSTNTWDFYSSNAIQIPNEFLNKTVNIAFKFTCDNKNSTTWEVQNFKVEEGTGGSSGGGGDEPSGETIGSLDNPKTCAEALALINALADGAESDGNAYVKGKVVKVTTNQTNFEKYGNLNYWISDDGSETNQIQVYSGDGLNGEKFKSITDIGPGDEVVVFGKLYKYVKDGKMTPEINKGNYLVKYTKGSGGGGGETPSTDAKKVTVAEFNAAEVNENVWYQLTGTVENLKDGDQYGNFDLKDETGSVYVYGLLSEKGGEKKKFQDLAAAKGIKNGSKITIIGTRGVHNDKIEVMNAYFVSIEGGGSSSEQGGGSSDEASSGDNGTFESWSDNIPTNWKTTSTAGNATLSQSSDAHGGSYSVKVGGISSANKRLGYKELQLKAGSYTLKFYAKAATSTGASVRPGYVPVTDGAVGNYTYGDYVNDITNTSWVEVTHSFDLASDGVYSIVIMNSKTPGGDVLIDDVTLFRGSTLIIK